MKQTAIGEGKRTNFCSVKPPAVNRIATCYSEYVIDIMDGTKGVIKVFKPTIALSVLVTVTSILLLFGLIGCSPEIEEFAQGGSGDPLFGGYFNDADTREAEIATAETMPTSQHLTAADLEPMLPQSSDLPDHLTPGKITNQFEPNISGNRGDKLWGANIVFHFQLPRPVYYVNQLFDGRGSASAATRGAMSVFVYGNPDLANIAYEYATTYFDNGQRRLEGQSRTISEGVGEEYRVFAYHGQEHIAFLRCNVFAYIWMWDVTTDDLAIYARHLDGKMTDLLCSPIQ